VTERNTENFQAQYVPPPPAQDGHIWVKAPVDARGNKLYSDLHLSPEHAEDLIAAIQVGLKAYLDYVAGLD
jgi:hypothetical protein